VSDDARAASLPTALAERVGRFCREFSRDGQLAELMAEAGAEDLLTEAVTLATTRTAGPAALTAALDAVEEVFAELGVHGLTSPDREWRPLPGVSAPLPELSVWVCPIRRCPRAETAPAACGLGGAPLTAVTIPR